MKMNMMEMEKSLDGIEDRRASERTVNCMEFESVCFFESEQLDPMDNEIDI